MKKIIAFCTVLFITFFATIALAAPTSNILRTILPETTSTYTIGNPTHTWLNLYTDQVCLNADCKTAWPTGAWPFTTGLTNFGVAVQATTTPEWFQNGMMASSTSYFVNASTTALTATSLCLTGDTCRTTWPTASAWPWTLTTNYSTTTNATTTPSWFQMGLFASSTSQFANATTSQQTVANILWLSSITNGILATDNNGKVVASSTIGSNLLSVPANSLLAGNASGALIASTTIGWNLLKGSASSIFAFDASGNPTATTSIGTNYVTGILPIAKGGTGQSTFTSSQLLYGNGTNGLTSVATSSITAGTGVTFSGTAGYLVGGTSLTLNTPWTISGSNIFNNNTANVGIGTTTPFWALTVASSTGPQLALTDTTASSNAWTFRNTGGTLYIATSTATATSTTAAITVKAGSPSALLVGTTTDFSTSNAATFTKGTGTTTISIGEIGNSSGKTCVNVQTSAGTAGYFYINGAGAVVSGTGNCTP